MTYNEFIQNIIKTRGQWNVDGYYEIHHIKPKCLGGLPKKPAKTSKHQNIIWLTGKEHFIAHKLLAKENPKNVKLTAAFLRMCHSKNCNYEITAEEYEEARKLHALVMQKRFLGNANPSRGKPNKHCLGKH